MSSILFHAPGQVVTIVLETLDGYGDGYGSSYGQRADSNVTPQITRIIFPNLSLAGGYPQPMTRIDTGLYRFQFTLPAQASAIGSYLVDITYNDPIRLFPIQKLVQIVVTAPFGMYSATTF